MVVFFESVSCPDYSQNPTCTRSSLHVCCLKLHLVDPPTKGAQLYSLLNYAVFTWLQPSHIQWQYLLPPKRHCGVISCSELNCEMSPDDFDLLARVFLSGPQSTSLPPPFRWPSDVWKWWPLASSYHSHHAHTNRSHHLLQAKCPSGLSYIQWVVNQKCLVSFFSLMAKSLWFTIKDCFGAPKMKGWVDR